MYPYAVLSSQSQIDESPLAGWHSLSHNKQTDFHAYSYN